MGTISNNQIFELLKRTSEDVQDIKQDLVNYKEEVVMLKESVETLERENEILKQKLVSQEELLKKKNILAFKIAETENESLEQIILELLNQKLKINKTISDIDNFYRLGEKKTGKTRPILIKFTRELVVREIFKNVHKLRGTGISIAPDLTQEKVKSRKTLYDFHKVAVQKGFAAKIKNNKLIINKDEYTADTLKTLDIQTFLEPIVDKHTLFRYNSAPTTPTIANESQSSEGEEELNETEIQKNTTEEINKTTKVKDLKQKIKPIKSPVNIIQTPKGRTTRSGSTSSTNNQQQPPKKTNNQKK